MTMIAFATYGDRAEIITDTASYLQNGSALSRCSKVVTIPHLDTAVTTQGDSAFGTDVKSAALQVAGQVTTFDELVDEFPRVLRDLWARRRAEWGAASDSVVFLIGYSPRVEAFRAWGFATDLDNLEPFAIEPTWVMPCPWGVRPDRLQVARFLADDADWAAQYDAEPTGPRFVDQLWSQQPTLTPPATLDEWVTLAQLVRQDRAVDDRFPSTYVAGDVFHTRIGRGEITSRKVHSFDDSGEEFLQMISGTQHPIAQLLPCPCDSGEIYLACCLAPALDQPCGCHVSGKTFRECCAVSAEVRRAAPR